ncbi:MAG TPA: hypothetical protein DDY98_09165 [Ruminococcaceae bacterium]|nr:hypothetical protein [Oscillospiraceae bacterium]
MLKLISLDEEPLLCRNQSLGIMISSYATIQKCNEAYCRIYRQNESAFLVPCGKSAVLCADENADFAEIKQFVDFLGCDTILCEQSNLEDDKTVRKNSGLILCGEFAENDDEIASPQTTAEYRSVFSLLETDGIVFEDWFTDITLRIRRGTAKLAAIFENGEAVATASILHRTQNRCILGAVATKESNRNRGLATELIRRLSEQHTTVLCLPELEAFYEKLGFRACGAWYEYKREL